LLYAFFVEHCVSAMTGAVKDSSYRTARTSIPNLRGAGAGVAAMMIVITP
jgi:hypothetical protein